MFFSHRNIPKKTGKKESYDFDFQSNAYACYTNLTFLIKYKIYTKLEKKMNSIQLNSQQDKQLEQIDRFYRGWESVRLNQLEQVIQLHKNWKSLLLTTISDVYAQNQKKLKEQHLNRTNKCSISPIISKINKLILSKSCEIESLLLYIETKSVNDLAIDTFAELKELKAKISTLEWTLHTFQSRMESIQS